MIGNAIIAALIGLFFIICLVLAVAELFTGPFRKRSKPNARRRQGYFFLD